MQFLCSLTTVSEIETMKTLIELYDERPLDNVLATEMFHPETTVYLCPPEIAQDKGLKEKLRAYFKARGCRTKIEFIPVSMLDADKIAQAMRRVIQEYPDCALDIAGGTDASLFACGLVSAQEDLAVFTYSRKKNKFFDIRGAAFSQNLPCPIRLNISDCFQMAGGSMLPGRMNNERLKNYLPIISDFYHLHQKYRAKWVSIITYIQRISRQEPGQDGLFTAEGPLSVRHNGRVLNAEQDVFRSLEKMGLIRDLRMDEENGIRFVFRDEEACFFLRDIGSVLELYTYKAAHDAGIFQDVRLSVVVNWEGGIVNSRSVTNELDVVAVRGVMPVFISCKTSEIKTEALNELAILRDRFGSAVSRAIIVTSAGSVRSVTRNRAYELGIEIIDQKDLQQEETFQERLRAIAKWPEISD